MSVLACGLATVDVVQVVGHVPTSDEKVVAFATRVESGGPALNAALTSALLGMPCRLVTAVGRAPLAAVVRAECAEHDVDRTALDIDDPDLLRRFHIRNFGLPRDHDGLGLKFR
mgnify:CR=1 FL=1